jgi:hypothetical protein
MKSNPSTIGKYKPGDIVFAKKHPKISLVVRRYVDRIYYCQFQDDLNKREAVLFEREIVGN